MRAFRATLSSFAVLALTGCATLQVRSDYDPGASFANLRTYTWIDAPADPAVEPALNSPLVYKRIQVAVDNALGSRGYQRITSGTPDFRIVSRVAAEPRARVSGSHGFGGFSSFGHSRFGHSRFGHSRFGRSRFGHGGFGHFGFGPYFGSTFVREYVQGTLVLDIIDAQTDELIWRGWAEDELDANPTPERVQKYVREAVAKMLESFPGTGARQIASAP